jgi:hypothetical protein
METSNASKDSRYSTTQTLQIFSSASSKDDTADEKIGRPNGKRHQHPKVDAVQIKNGDIPVLDPFVFGPETRRSRLLAVNQIEAG